jgi:hypothetical protein
MDNGRNGGDRQRDQNNQPEDRQALHLSPPSSQRHSLELMRSNWWRPIGGNLCPYKHRLRWMLSLALSASAAAV